MSFIAGVVVGALMMAGTVKWLQHTVRKAPLGAVVEMRKRTRKP